MNHSPASIETEVSREIQLDGVSYPQDFCQKSQAELVTAIRQLEQVILRLQRLVCLLLTRNEQLRHQIHHGGLDTEP